MIRRRLAIWASVGGLAAFGAGVSCGARWTALCGLTVAAFPIAAPSTALAEDPLGDVTLEDLGSIKSEIEAVQLAFERKEWEQGFSIIRELLAKPEFTSRLYPSHGEKGNELYIPVERYFLTSFLSMVPPEEAERFRASFDPSVELAVRRAHEGDPRMLEQMENRLEASRSAGAAYKALGSLCWERGDPWRAADLWRRGAQGGGGTDAELVARYLLAAAPSGRVEETLAARATSVRLPGSEQPVARWTGLFGGAERETREALSAWPQFGGSVSGTAHAPAVPQGAYVSLRGAGLVSSGPGMAGGRQVYGGQPGARRIPYHPALSGGRIHLSDGLNYSAYELASGKKKAGSQNSPASSSRVGYRQSGFPDYSFASPCSTGEAVYILSPVPPSADDAQRRMQQGFVPSIVQAYDPVSGKTLPIRFRYADGKAPLELCGAPVAWRRYLLVCGADQNGGLSLVCFDRFRGAELWRTFLCFKPAPMMRGYGVQMDSMPAFLSIDRETVYVCTNRGALVSVDPHSGRRNWAVRYPAFAAPNPNNPMPAVAGWDANPVIAHEGRVLIAPMDSQLLLCYDGADGSMVWKTSPAAKEDAYQHVLGPVDGKIYAIGPRGGMIYEWQGGKRLERIIGFPGGGFLGRPVLTSDSLYVAARETPSQGGIYRVDLRTKKLADKLIAWPEQSAAQYGADRLPEGANLAVISGFLVAVTDKVFYIYSLSADAVSELEDRIGKRPSDAEAYLSLVRYHLGKGDGGMAVEVLKRALQRPGAPADDADLLRGIDEVCGTFVREAMEKGRGEEISPFLERLGREIPAAAARAPLRLAAARSFEARSQRDRACEIYAELARSPAAKVDLGGGAECHLPAYAESQLWRLASKGPPSKTIRDWAAEASARAQEAAREPSKRALEAARLAAWGVHASGPKAVSDVVNALAAAGHREEARVALAGALSRLDPEASARVIEGVKDEPLARGLVFALAAADPSVELKLGSSRRSAAAHMKEAMGGPSAGGKPPSAPSWKGKAIPGAAYLMPLEGDRSACSREWILSRNPATLGKAFDAATGAETVLKWPKELGVVIQAFQAGGFLVVQGGQGVAAVDPESLKPVWTLPVSGAMRTSVAAGVLVVLAAQSVMGVDLCSGEPIWSFRVEGGYELCAHPSGRLVLAGSGGLHFRDLRTGDRLTPAIPLPPSERLFLRPGRSAAVAVLGCRANQGWVRGFDLETLKQRFEAEETMVVGWEARVLPHDGDRVVYPSGMEVRLLDMSDWKAKPVAIRTDNRPAADLVLGEKDLLVRTLDGGTALITSFRLDTGAKRWRLTASAAVPLLVDIGRWVVYCAPSSVAKPGVVPSLKVEFADRENGKREAELESLPPGSVGGEWWAWSGGLVLKLTPGGELIGITRGKPKGE